MIDKQSGGGGGAVEDRQEGVDDEEENSGHLFCVFFADQYDCPEM